MYPRNMRTRAFKTAREETCCKLHGINVLHARMVRDWRLLRCSSRLMLVLREQCPCLVDLSGLLHRGARQPRRENVLFQLWKHSCACRGL
jgi:hypothetical protein